MMAAREPGGDKLLDWIDRCPNQLYSALVFQGGAAWRKRLLDEIGDQGPVTALIERRTDEDLLALMSLLVGFTCCNGVTDLRGWPTLEARWSSIRKISFLVCLLRGGQRMRGIHSLFCALLSLRPVLLQFARSPAMNDLAQPVAAVVTW